MLEWTRQGRALNRFTSWLTSRNVVLAVRPGEKSNEREPELEPEPEVRLRWLNN